MKNLFKRTKEKQSIKKETHLVHTSLIESHYRGMSKPVKDGPQCLFGVKFLWLKKLFKELFVEHGGDYVIHNYSDKTEKKVTGC